MTIKSELKKAYTYVAQKVVLTIGKVKWKTDNTLDAVEQATIRKMLIENYYIILTRRNNHLSTFFTSLANFVLTGKWGYWSHALMNMEDEVNSKADFRLIEAVGKGVVFTPFDKVFDVHSVCLLRPKNMAVDQWTCVLDQAKKELGKPYDTLFDIANDNNLSCVELVRAALMADPNYANDFADFEASIKKSKNLSPDMFYGLDDFEVAYEVRRKK